MREDDYLTAEVRKTQEQKEVRGVKSHQPSAANALYVAEQCFSTSMGPLNTKG